MTMGRVASHLAALLVVGVFLTICAFVWFPSSPPAEDPGADSERQHVRRQCAAALKLDEQYFNTVGQVVHAGCGCEPDGTDWMMLRVQGGEVTRIRRAIVKDACRAPNPRLRQQSFVKSDNDLLGHHGEGKPAWWTPTQLPDAEIVVIGGERGDAIYVFSEETGTIYVMRGAA
jgi:hypothetical protein